MSSSLIWAQTALGRPVGFARKEGPALILKRLSAMPQLAGVTPASRLEVKPAQEMVSSGIGEIDALTGGLPRGGLSEICGPASSGRTCVLLAALAAATQREEVCALVDATDAFAPESAEAAGVDFQRLLWVRGGGTNSRPRTSDFSSQTVVDDLTGRSRSEVRHPTSVFVEQALRITDLLLQSGGFGLVAIDLGDVPFKTAQRIPLTSWFRFQRAVEHAPTVLLVVVQAPCAQTCASLLLKLKGPASVVGRQSLGKDPRTKILPPHAQLLDGLHIQGELLRSRLERKPAGSVTTAFATKAVRAG